MATDWAFFDRPATDVENNVALMNGRADTAIAKVNEIVTALGQLTFDTEPTPPNIVLPEIQDFKPTTVTPGNPLLFGTVQQPNIPPYEDLSTNLGLNLSDLEITIPDFVLPPPVVFPADPAPMDTSGKPDRPLVNTQIPIPAAPDVVLPDIGELAAINIPAFQFPDLPLFDGVEPTFDTAPPSTNLVWSEPVYSSELMTDLTSRIHTMLAGGTGLPQAIQQALFDAARGREADTALEAEQGAFDDFAGRGFSMPPGMLSAAVAKAREKSRLEQNTLERDILTKSAQWEIENLRVAVEKGLAYETLLINQFNNMAERGFQAAKYRVEADIQLFNAMVTLYNARQNGFRVLAEVFKIKVDAALAKLEVFKAQIQGAIAQGQLNEQIVKVFLAKMEGVKTIIELFKSKMEGAKVQSEVVKNIIESYDVDVKAWSAKISAEKERFAAYYELVRAKAEVSRAVEWEAKAYEATIRGQEAKSNAKVRFIDARINAIRASVEKLRVGIEAEQLIARTSLEAIQAKAAAFSADTQRYAAEIHGVNTAREVTLRLAEDRLRNNLAYFEVLYKEYDAKLSRVLDEVKIKEAGLDAAARTTSTLAAGAMSAIHLQASVHGQASLSESNSYSVTHNFQDA
jgi:hypothetical protein